MKGQRKVLLIKQQKSNTRSVKTFLFSLYILHSAARSVQYNLQVKLIVILPNHNTFFTHFRKKKKKKLQLKNKWYEVSSSCWQKAYLIPLPAITIFLLHRFSFVWSLSSSNLWRHWIFPNSLKDIRFEWCVLKM